jgi:hypothetical protein
MHDIETEIEKEPSIGLDAAALDESLANAKSRFGRTDLSVTPPIAPALSEHARELQQLRSQLNDAERMALRAQKAAGEYREQLTEAQADIANMKSRWYAAEKARNAVSSQREVDSSGLNTQVVRLQKELERSQQLASSDMERAATRIRSLEEKLEKALRHASVAEDSQKKSRKRSNVSLALGIAVASIFTGIFVYEKLPRSKSEVTAPTETTGVASASRPETQIRRSQPARPAMPLEALSTKPFVPKLVSKNLPEALGRLEKAFQNLPGLDPQAVIQRVSKAQSTPDRPVCQFEWANGGPSMVFDQTKKDKSMENWALAISRCADAVEQSH